MKSKIIVFAILFSFCSSLSAQTFSFSKLIKKANVQTATGNQYRTLGTYSGPFRFVFETPRDNQIKRLFTILKPGQENGPGLPWFGMLSEGGYIEKNEKLLKKYTFFDTEREEKVTVLIADDYSMIVIFKRDDTIWEYIK